jgi:nitrogen fixation protein NifQ
MTGRLYQFLRACGRGEAFDVHVLASVIARRVAGGGAVTGKALGLDAADLVALLATYFPAFPSGSLVSSLCDRAEQGALADEFPDLRDLLLEHAADAPLSRWLAGVVARAALCPNHLWEDLGLRNRGEVSALMHRHFPALAQRNAGSRMRWKKFLYKQLCDKAEVSLCRAPNCNVCDEHSSCFSTEQTALDRDAGTAWLVGGGA